MPRTTRRGSGRYRALAWVLAAAGLLSTARPVAGQAPATEAEVKAAYLYNFGRFVEWPADGAGATGPLRMCVIGMDPFGPVLDSAVSDGLVGGRAVQPQRVTTIEDSQRCHVLFVSDSERERLDAILAALKGTNVLTVSDIPQFVRRGGMIQFTRQGGRLRFEINLPATQEARLLVSSDLLRVASAVRR